MDIQKKNRELLKKNHVYDEKMEHDACGVGLVASTEGLKSRKVVENSFIQQAVKTLKPAQIGKIIASPDSGGLGVDAVRELMKLSKDLKAALPKGFDETYKTFCGT